MTRTFGQSFFKLWLFSKLFLFEVNGQIDSVSYQLELGQVISGDNTLPLYVHSQRGGIFGYSYNGFFLRPSLEMSLFQKENSGLSAGIDFIISGQNSLVTTQQAFLEYRIRNFVVFAGKKEWHSETDLGLGNYGISNNARPIPKIGISLDEYWFPFKNKYLGFKGNFYHGWFENDRFVESALLHEKALHGILKLGKVFIDGSLNHFAIWGGRINSTGVDLLSDFSAFTDVFFGRGNNETATGEQNGLGNHLGFWDFGFNWELKDLQIEVYNQTLFEDGKSWQFWDLDESKDRIVGLNFDLSKITSSLIKNVSLQYMTTVFQQGPGLPDGDPNAVNNFGFPFGGRDDNYNNFIYRDGWTYFNRPLGNPLFIDRELGKYLFGPVPDYDVAIINNRIRAFHIGVSGELHGLRWKFLGTYSRNFGTYAGLYEGRFAWEGIQTNPDFEYTFFPALDQYYFLLEGKGSPFKNKKIELSMSLGIDQGEISNNYGIYMGINYMGFLKDLNFAKRNL